MSEYNFLIVEDSPTMRQLISFSLKRIQNAKIVEASDGVDALKKLSEGKFHLIIADINMPMMDGLKLLSIIRKDPQYNHVPVIIVTTEGAEADREKGMKLGANAYLSKPIQTNDLVKTVKDLLKIHS
ncbi:MAG: response regulator [Nitrospira sp.]|nr:response regulator [Nitrospira sp.]